MKRTDTIPEGMYCYVVDSFTDRGIKVKFCPHYDLIKGKPDKMNGYCHLLKCGDWENGNSNLFDFDKICGINNSLDQNLSGRKDDWM